MTIATMLAARSHFSLGEAIFDVADLVKAAVEMKQPAVALIDTMSVNGLMDLTTAATKAGIKPIIGCRLRLVENLTWRKTKDDKKAPPEYFVTWYVLSEAGLRALYRLLTIANDDDHFYGNARLGFADLYDALASVTADDVAIASSDVLSVSGAAHAAEILQRSRDILSASSVYLTLSPIDTPLFDTLNQRAIELARELGLPTLVTYPTLYPAAGADAQEILQAVSRNVKISDPWHWSPFIRDFSPKSDAQLVGLVKKAIGNLKERRGVMDAADWFKQGIANQKTLIDRVAYLWAKQAPSLPIMAPDENAALVAACKKGWAERFGKEVFGHRPSEAELRDVYMPRLKYELQVLRDLKFAGYFLLVQDVVMAAKSRGIAVGPGRGSVGGSLVAYLMGITETDPIRFNLMFERFINPERNDLPDADLDFESTRRHEVIQYLVDKYGTARVAGISNYTMLGGASAIRDVSRTCGLEERDYGCSKLVPKVHGQPVGLEEAADQVAEISQFAEKHTTIWSFCRELEGKMRSYGRHAAGIVVGGCDLVERAVIERRSDEPTVNWDKNTVELQGLVKMDILGLETLGILELAKAYVWKRHGKRVDLGSIPLDDPKILDNFAKGWTTGIFQFESPGMKRLLRDLGADGTLTFEDAVAATALYRPGPMDSGMMESYVRRKQGTELVAYEHPNMEPILASTYGVMVYQEQVMKVSQALAGFSGAKADKLRKAMGKKLPEEMAKFREDFVNGCCDVAGMTEDEATELFDKIEVFAGYGFNRSHSVEYTLISYQSMWMKTYWPVEFYAACLSLMKDEKLPGLLKDMAVSGIEVLPPDINHSTDQFEILTDTKLLIPFSRVKGIGANTVAAILEARKVGPFTSVDDLEKRVEKRRCNVAHRDKLRRVGAFASIDPAELPAKHPDRVKDQIELMPGLVSDTVPIGRPMVVETMTKAKLISLIARYQEAEPGLVKPCLGKTPRFMVVFDAPSIGEERAGQMTMAESFQSVSEALADAGLKRADGYWTALTKRPKAGKQVEPDEIKAFAPVLAEEINILKPPVILLLGSAAARHFIKDLKGNIIEHAGKVVYDKELDANLVVGFSPGMIYHDPDKQEVMNALFHMIAEMIA